MTQGVVYWKHTADMDDDYSDGYIGISKHFEERQKQHHRDAFVRNSIYTVHEKMRQFGDEVITDIIFEGTIEECFDLEEQLRPRWHMGWNMAIGGGRPGSGWKPNPDWMCNRLWHPEHGEVIINSSFKIFDMTKLYLNSSNRAQTRVGAISSVLHGKLPDAYGWELANAQLAQRVKDRCAKRWNHVFLHKDGVVVSITHEKQNDFYNAFNVRKGSGIIQMLYVGKKERMYGWELTTEQEWLDATERYEFK